MNIHIDVYLLIPSTSPSLSHTHRHIKIILLESLLVTLIPNIFHIYIYNDYNLLKRNFPEHEFHSYTQLYPNLVLQSSPQGLQWQMNAWQKSEQI